MASRFPISVIDFISCSYFLLNFIIKLNKNAFNFHDTLSLRIIFLNDNNKNKMSLIGYLPRESKLTLNNLN